MPRQECRKVPKEFSTFQTVQECGNVNKDICRPVPRGVEFYFLECISLWVF